MKSAWRRSEQTETPADQINKIIPFGDAYGNTKNAGEAKEGLALRFFMRLLNLLQSVFFCFMMHKDV